MHWARPASEHCEDGTVLVGGHVKILYFQLVVTPFRGSEMMVQYNIGTSSPLVGIDPLNACYESYVQSRRHLPVHCTLALETLNVFVLHFL